MFFQVLIWSNRALVEQYDQIFNWNNEFTPLSYSDAIEQVSAKYILVDKVVLMA